MVSMEIKINFTYTAQGNEFHRIFMFNYAFQISFSHNDDESLNNNKQADLCFFFSIDNSVKNVLYQIPSNAKEVEAESNCGVDDILVVSWNETNKFTMKFSENSTKYALSSFVIAMNTSSLYNDSKGE